jgi:hypothetical protein
MLEDFPKREERPVGCEKRLFKLSKTAGKKCSIHDA